MTRRWQPGKEPTKAEVKAAITNAMKRFADATEVEAIAEAVMRLYRDRASGKR